MLVFMKGLHQKLQSLIVNKPHASLFSFIRESFFWKVVESTGYETGKIDGLITGCKLPDMGSSLGMTRLVLHFS